VSEPDYLLATERAQRVIAGLEPPPVELAVNFGAPLDLESGIIRCPDCGIDSIDLIETVSFPAGGSPDHAGVFLDCTICGCGFAITVDREDGRCLLRTARRR
jgi:hypothetical protein